MQDVCLLQIRKAVGTIMDLEFKSAIETFVNQISGKVAVKSEMLTNEVLKINEVVR